MFSRHCSSLLRGNNRLSAALQNMWMTAELLISQQWLLRSQPADKWYHRWSTVKQALISKAKLPFLVYMGHTLQECWKFLNKSCS